MINTSTMDDPNTLHLGDYFAILRRRRKQIYYIATGVFALAAILAVAIPSVYRSTATILIEQQEVPSNIISSTVTGYAMQRLQIIQQRVLTRESLLGIIDKYRLGKDTDDVQAESELIGRMRGNILVEPLSSSVTDPRSGKSHLSAIAFTLSFDSNDPQTAQKVAEELAQLFLKENQRIRTQKAESASGFLAGEEEKLSLRLAELEKQLTVHKEKYSGRLPELMGMNMSLLERTQKELEDLERHVYSMEERKLQLQAQLATIEPYSGKSAGGRLREANAEYVSAAAVYSPDHPDVVRLRREVEQLKKEAGIVDERDVLEPEIRKARGELADAQQKYAANHPDVVSRKNSLALLEERFRNARATTGRVGTAIRPDNPAYIAVQTQIDTVDLSLRAAREQKARAKEKLGEYERRVVQTPRVEQEGLALQREYANALKKYQELKQSLMGAELAVELEKEDRGERFSILEPPKLPTVPHIPNRRAFLLLGLVLGVGGGIGYASMAEYMDRTVRGARIVASVTGSLPLAVIPDLSIEKVT